MTRISCISLQSSSADAPLDASYSKMAKWDATFVSKGLVEMLTPKPRMLEAARVAIRDHT